MDTSKVHARIVLTTTATVEQARELGRTLVDERLAACATIVPAVESIYRWRGEIETSGEALLLLKTDVKHLEGLRARLLAMHSYEVPESLVLPVESGSEGYLKWLGENLREPESSH